MMGTGVKEKKANEGDMTFVELTDMLKPHIRSEDGSMIKLKPKIVLEIAYEEIQKSPNYSSGFALRFPRLVRLRTDKGPDEADDIERLERLYRQQKGKEKT
jgi:DNA ligase-1